MEYLHGVWGVISSLFVLLLGFVIAIKLAKLFGLGWRRSVVIYIWHTLFSVLYLVYTLNNGGDAVVYYYSSLISGSELSFGTFAINTLTRIFSYYLQFSILGVFLVYNIIGMAGLLAFDASLRYASAGKIWLAGVFSGLIIFLPSVSFWSAAIGKDAISFLSAGLALWAVINLGKRTKFFTIAILLMLFVRPHIAGLMILSLAIAAVFQKKLSLGKKIFLIGASFSAAVVAIPFALQYSGLGTDTEADDLQGYIEKRQGYNMDGGGGVDISSMSFPMKLITYLFRPLPFEAHSIFSFASSVDNVILMALFILSIYMFVVRLGFKMPPSSVNRVFLLVYSILTWVILAMTTSNLGISVRQKWMFVPMLAFLLISMMPKKKLLKRDTSRIVANSAAQKKFKK